MKAFLQACTITWVLALSACGGRAEGNTDATPSTAINVPLNPLPLTLNPLPLSERN